MLFSACRCESNTQDLDNDERLHEVLRLPDVPRKGRGYAAPAAYVSGDAAYMPLILPGLMHGEGAAGYPSGVVGLTKEITDWDGTKQYNWLPYALSTSNVTNVAQVTSSRSSFSKLNGMITWHFGFTFQATVAGTRIEIVPPYPVPAVYSSLSGLDPYLSLWVDNGYGFMPTYGGFSNDGNLYIAAPAANGGWLTSGDSNQVFLMVQYHQ